MGSLQMGLVDAEIRDSVGVCPLPKGPFSPVGALFPQSAEGQALPDQDGRGWSYQAPPSGQQHSSAA